MSRLGVTVLYDPGKANCGEKLARGEGHHCAAFDIVAIHGLNGDAYNTWTHGKTGRLWLRDMLPAMLPETRIMTYGYNAKFDNIASQQDLYSIASKLLSELVDVRRQDTQKNRSIVLICHSLGGIVAKKALVLRPTDVEQRNIQDCTYGIIFMGTPHAGSELASYGKSIANIVAKCTPLNPARRLLGILRTRSNALFELSRDFAAQMQNLTIVTFYEMEKTDLILRRKTIVNMDSAILRTPNEISIGQNADHVQITKFEDEEDVNYRPVVSNLVRIAEGISNILVEAAKTLCLTAAEPEAETTVVFEAPVPKNSTFWGRENWLVEMNEFFTRPHNDDDYPLVYVIAGLGGAGKSRTAMQYARIHQDDRYRNNVFWINAASTVSIRAATDRFVSILTSGDRKPVASSHGVNDFNKWLERKTQGNWLLILDGADDLGEVDLLNVFPNSHRGHIIVTTRDQAASNFIGAHTKVMEGMEEAAAYQALLDKAAIKHPSADEVDTARRISKLLGHLPLAIDQAGAYIRDHRKGLPEYERIFLKRSKDLLLANSRLSNRDQTLQAVWGVNLEQLKHKSEDAIMLLSILAFLEPSEVELNMLRRGCAGKKMWDQHGSAAIVPAIHTGMDERLIELINNEVAFDKALDHLQSYSFVWWIKTTEGASALALHPLIQLYAAQRIVGPEALHWRKQAILLVCHAFPYNSYLEFPDFGTVGRPMFHHIPAILKVLDEINPETECDSKFKRSVVTMLLSASVFNTMSSKKDLISRAKRLLPNESDLYLATWTATRESEVFRISGDVKHSYGVLEQYINELAQSPSGGQNALSARSNGQRGELLLSYASILLQTGKTSQAKSELEAWQPLDRITPSKMEEDVARQRHVMLGRTLRNEGQFQKAIFHYEKVLRDFSSDPVAGRFLWENQLLVQLSGLYCEVGLPSQAIKLLQPEMEGIRVRGTAKLPRSTDIFLHHAEALIRKGLWAAAREQLVELDVTFGEIEEQNIMTRTKHFRVKAGLARIAHLTEHWSDAHSNWDEALQMIRRNDWTRTFNGAVALLSMSHVLYALGNTDGKKVQLEEASSYRSQAEESLRTEGPQNWIVGLGTYWFNYVNVPLGSKGPSPVIPDTRSHLADLKEMITTTDKDA